MGIGDLVLPNNKGGVRRSQSSENDMEFRIYVLHLVYLS